MCLTYTTGVDVTVDVIQQAIAALAHAGDNIVSTTNLYGGTYNQLKVFLPRLGINTKFVNGDKAEDFAKAIDENTKAGRLVPILICYFFVLRARELLETCATRLS